jgi:hypothetical protein
MYVPSFRTGLAALVAVGGLATTAYAQLPPAAAVPQTPQVVKWPGGYLMMNGSEVIVRSSGPGGSSTNLVTGSGNDSGADIVFHAAGGTGNGVFTEAKERKEADPEANVWVIGVDADQYDEGQVGDANVTLTSVLKRVDQAVLDISNKAKEGNFPGGETTTYGLADDGVGLADSRGAIPDDVMAKIDEYKEKIASGEVTVPETLSE